MRRLSLIFEAKIKLRNRINLRCKCEGGFFGIHSCKNENWRWVIEFSQFRCTRFEMKNDGESEL